MLQQEFKKHYWPHVRRVVVKIGSQILSSRDGIEEGRIKELARDVALLHDRGKELVIVSSGAVAAGMTRLQTSEGPKTIPQKQALAAVGQIQLMAVYEKHFSSFGKIVAQVLLTHGDIADRRRYLNARHTFQTLLDFSIIPIVNENDTVAVEEMNFGDNDQLSSLVATLLKADLLVILSDVNGVYDQDPRASEDARLIPVLTRVDEIKEKLGGASLSPYGRGGISSKLSAAQKAAAAGIPTMIVNGQESGILARVFEPEDEVGTLVIPEGNPLAHRKHWIAYNLKPAGEIVVDPGAYHAVVQKGKSLLAAGLKEVRGSFREGDCVRCLDVHGREFARGLVNYGAGELNQIKGLHSSKIEGVLGHKAYDEVIHRDDLVLI